MIRERRFLIGAFAIAASVMACGSDSNNTSSGTSGTSGTVTDAKAQATVAKGEEAVGKRRCAQCHDSTAGKMAGASKAITQDLQGNAFPTSIELYPPNLTPDFETGLGNPEDPTAYTDEKLVAAIRQGKDRDDLKLCPQMQHFSDMSDFEVYSIIKYLRSLPPVKNKVLRSVCPPIKTKEQQEAAK